LCNGTVWRKITVPENPNSSGWSSITIFSNEKCTYIIYIYIYLLAAVKLHIHCGNSPNAPMNVYYDEHTIIYYYTVIRLYFVLCILYINEYSTLINVQLFFLCVNVHNNINQVHDSLLSNNNKLKKGKCNFVDFIRVEYNYNSKSKKPNFFTVCYNIQLTRQTSINWLLFRQHHSQKRLF